jgi:GNAT superfamily N-acetyltransferase
MPLLTEVAGVHVRSWQHAYRGLFSDEYLDGLRPEDRAARYTFAGGPDQPLTIVALEDGAIRGFATIAPTRGDSDGKTGELFALYVDPDHWGRGIGRRLMVEARNRLVDRGFENAVLWVLRGNDRAERFYRSDGWMPDGARREEEVWGVAADELRYRRTLG